jgi:outer membrane protein TolC
MRRLEQILATILAAAALAGCATSALDMAPPRPDRPWTPPTTETGEIKAGEKAQSDGSGYVLPANSALAKVPPAADVDGAKAYTLPALIDIAESSNPSTRVAWNDARRVALAEGIAESAFLPKLTASAVGAYQTASGHDSALGVTVNGNNSAAGTISALSLEWLLFDFGERAAVVDAAKQASVVSNIAFTAVHQQVIYDVSRAFYAHAAARARVATAQQSLGNAEAVQAAAEGRRAHGIGTVVEVAQARQATAQANLAVVQADGAAQDAYITLVAAMGISPLTKMKIADISDRKLSPALGASVESVIAAALARRPDMLSAYAAEKASAANVRAAEAEFMPKFFLSATGAYNSGSLSVTALPSIGQQASTVNISGSHLSGILLAGVVFPLYDGGTRSAVLAQAKADADNAEAKLAHVREEAVRQIVVADNALHTSLAAYGASQALAAAAQTTFDAALAAYRNGVGSITDATMAETQLLQARNATTDTYNTALTAAATLALATGALGAAPQ